MDFRQYYNLESYLFDTVGPRFARQGYLSAFDFFCIVIWKANRAKSKLAKRLLARGYNKLDDAVYALTSGLAHQPTAKDKLYYLWHTWGFYLPMASAILTILYPDEFTIYDWRVCEMLNGYEYLGTTGNFEKLWPGYEQYKTSVQKLTPDGMSLRDRDRYLWGKSFYEQLVKDVEKGFTAAQAETAFEK
jgi:hypothetical protein